MSTLFKELGIELECLAVVTALLFATTQGMAMQLAGLRQQREAQMVKMHQFFRTGLADWLKSGATNVLIALYLLNHSWLPCSTPISLSPLNLPGNE